MFWRGDDWPRSKFDNFCFEPPTEAITLGIELILALKVQPKLCRCAEKAAQPQSGICRDATLSQHDFIHAPRRNANVFRKPILRYGKRLEKLLQEYFSWMYWWKFDLLHTQSRSVVIYDFHLVGMASFPAEADSPLHVD